MERGQLTTLVNGAYESTSMQSEASCGRAQKGASRTLGALPELMSSAIDGTPRGLGMHTYDAASSGGPGL